jgi:hypothetical protein
MRRTATSTLEVATSLLALSDRLKGGEIPRRVAMALLFDNISDCLAALSSEMRKGRIPAHVQCARLITYAQSLPESICKEVGEADADMLGNTLTSGYNFERLIAETSADVDEAALAQLEEACGKFRALAHCLDIESYLSRTSITVDLSETIVDTLFRLAELHGLKPKDLAAASLMESLQTREGFEDALHYVLKKNEELYNRLDR